MAASNTGALEFVAVAKSGVHIYDVTHFMAPKAGQRGHEDWEQNVADAADWKFEPLVSLPPSSGPAGFCYSSNGEKLVTVEAEVKEVGAAGATVVSGGPAVVWDATKRYTRLLSIDAVGASGGIRAVQFSPASNYVVTHEKYDKEKCLQNVAVWDIRCSSEIRKVKGNQLRGYSSGKVPLNIYQWTSDDQVCLELCPGTGVLMLDGDMESMDAIIPEPGCGQVSVSPLSAEAASVAVYVPEAASKAGHVSIYSIDNVNKGATVKIGLPTKLNGVEMKWNKDGSSVLIQASSDVDPTGQSYFGTTSLFWVQADGKQQQKICGPEDGLVQDFAWAPNGGDFLIIVGMMPAETRLYDGKTGKLVQSLGKSRRNTIRWNPFGRFVMVGGFGTLPGDLDFFDNVGKETLCSFRANVPVESSWAPDGRHFLTCTTCPRMNQDNQVYIYNYLGEQVVHLPFSPKKVRGGPARVCFSGAMLYAAAWRPTSGFADHPASPRGPTGRRTNGCLPSEGDGFGMFSLVPEERDTRTWEEMEADKRKRQQDKKEAEKQLEGLKQELKRLDTLKDKEWDEQTSEDEAALEGEIDLKVQIQELEEKIKKGVFT